MDLGFGVHGGGEAGRDYRRLASGARPALVNGKAGLVGFAGERPFAVLGFTIRLVELFARQGEDVVVTEDAVACPE